MRQSSGGRRLGLAGAGFVLAGMLWGESSAGAEFAVIAPEKPPFIVFDATLYKNKPSFSDYPGFRPITVLYEWPLFRTGQSSTGLPSEQTVRSVVKELGEASEPVVLDIERWPLKGDVQAVKTSVSKLLAVWSWIKDEMPRAKIGTYGTVPLPDYWRAIRGPTNAEFQTWQQDNDRLDELLPHMDAVYPSIYTFYSDRQGWVTYAIAQIGEARRKAKGKPVYAFLWPQYHESNHLIGLEPIEPDYWELQLNTVSQHADGVVIWGGWGKTAPEPWNEAASWWQVTKRFMKRIDEVAPKAPSGLKTQ
jgi:hypothetical protein